MVHSQHVALPALWDFICFMHSTSMYLCTGNRCQQSRSSITPQWSCFIVCSNSRPQAAAPSALRKLRQLTAVTGGSVVQGFYHAPRSKQPQYATPCAASIISSSLHLQDQPGRLSTISTSLFPAPNQPRSASFKLLHLIHCFKRRSDHPKLPCKRLKQRTAQSSVSVLACPVIQEYLSLKNLTQWQTSSVPAAPCPASIGLHTKVSDG